MLVTIENSVHCHDFFLEKLRAAHVALPTASRPQMNMPL
jgi:hypothetical protein